MCNVDIVAFILFVEIYTKSVAKPFLSSVIWMWKIKTQHSHKIEQ